MRTQAEIDLEKDLVRRAKEGDQDAFKDLESKYKPAMFSLCGRILKDDDAATDVTQNALIKAFTKIHLFRGDSALGTWLFRITANECYMYLRETRGPRRKPVFSVGLMRQDGLISEAEVHGRVPKALRSATKDDKVLMRMILHEQITNALGRLTRKNKFQFLEYALEGKSPEMIAAERGVKVSTVKSAIHRAREVMRQYLRQQGIRP